VSMGVIAYYYARKALARVRRIETITHDHVSAPHELEPLVELELFAVTGSGHVTVVFNGDGDGVFIIRVYVDNVLECEFYTNEFRIAHYVFNSNLRIVLHNPLTSRASHSSTSFSVRGVKVY
jgi:hypothetical protein